MAQFNALETFHGSFPLPGDNLFSSIRGRTPNVGVKIETGGQNTTGGLMAMVERDTLIKRVCKACPIKNKCKKGTAEDVEGKTFIPLTIALPFHSVIAQALCVKLALEQKQVLEVLRNG